MPSNCYGSGRTPWASHSFSLRSLWSPLCYHSCTYSMFCLPLLVILICVFLSCWIVKYVSYTELHVVLPIFLHSSAVASGICKYDSCLMELFYPITDLYSHNVAEFALRFTQEATAAAMTLIFIAFGALYVSRSWGNWPHYPIPLGTSTLSLYFLSFFSLMDHRIFHRAQSYSILLVHDVCWSLRLLAVEIRL